MQAEQLSEEEARKENSKTDSSLEKIFNPRSIAILGASPLEGKLGRSVLENIEAQGFPGKIFPVNPSFPEVLGRKCYPNVLDLPETPDLAVLLIPATSVHGAMKRCLAKGIKDFIIMSAGFNETNDSEGLRRERELADLAKESGARIVGPNCLGIFDNVSKIDTFFVPRTLIQRPERGDVSLASQSGSFVAHLLDLASSENLGIARAITYGNRVDVDEADALNYFSTDLETKIIGLYVEGVSDGRKFVRALEKCSRKKNVIVLKSGRYEKLAGAITSHTGAIAGSYSSYQAAFKKAGAAEVDSLEEFVDAFKGLSLLPLANGNRVLVLGQAGGLGLSAADHCIANGLTLPKTPDHLAKAVRCGILPFASVSNPVDLTASGTDEHTEHVLNECLLKSKNFVDMAIYLALWGLPQNSERIGRIVSDIIKKSGKPVVVASLQTKASAEMRHVFEDLGVPVFFSIRRAALVAAHLCNQHEKMRH